MNIITANHDGSICPCEPIRIDSVGEIPLSVNNLTRNDELTKSFLKPQLERKHIVFRCGVENKYLSSCRLS